MVVYRIKMSAYVFSVPRRFGSELRPLDLSVIFHQIVDILMCLTWFGDVFKQLGTVVVWIEEGKVEGKCRPYRRL